MRFRVPKNVTYALMFSLSMGVALYYLLFPVTGEVDSITALILHYGHSIAWVCIAGAIVAHAFTIQWLTVMMSYAALISYGLFLAVLILI